MRNVRPGFTKLELLACMLAVVAIWMFFVLAVGRSHRYARQATCMNHIGVNLAKAHLQFHQTNDRFCGYVNSVGHDHKCVSWVVPLFPYIDRQDLANAWNGMHYDWKDEANGIPEKIKHPDTYIEVLICPTNPPVNEKISPLCYVVNGGYAEDTQPACADPDQVPCLKVADGTGENIGNGVFHDHYGPEVNDGFNPRIASVVRLKYLATHDGASKTLMLSENVQLVKTWYTFGEDRAPLSMLWWDRADTKETAFHRINAGKQVDLDHLPATMTPKDFARPSSFHVGGVNVAFCDGHGIFLHESIDYKVYKQLMTTAGDLSDDGDNISVEDYFAD